MKLQVALVVLMMLSLPGISEEAKPARLGVTRGYALGSFWAEIQITAQCMSVAITAKRMG
jgi:hypothetical protein